jgi:hypothetical protein
MPCHFTIVETQLPAKLGLKPLEVIVIKKEAGTMVRPRQPMSSTLWPCNRENAVGEAGG